MAETWLQHLHEWREFYLLIGTAAATLTGLMFVVVSIGPHVIATRGSAGVRAFVTPAVVHFTTVLVVSALMMMPSLTPAALAGLLVLGSLGVLTYIFVIGVHAQWRQSKLDREDWLGYVALPILSYLVMLAAAAGVWHQSELGLVTLGASQILLLVVGIRNAWDLVIWLAQKARG